MKIIKVIASYNSVKWVGDDGHIYRFKRELKNGKEAYMCCHKRDCQGSIVVSFPTGWERNPEDGELVDGRGQPHSSVECRDKLFLDAEILRKKIIERAKRENTPNSIIFQEELSQAPVEIQDRLCFKSIERSMQRAHHEANPATPINLREFGELIEAWEERYGQVNRERFFVGSFDVGGDDQILVAIIQPILYQIDANCHLHLDGTFKCRPKEPKTAQLFVVMATQYGRAFPILWALMTNKNAAAYCKVFDVLKNIRPALNPTVIMSDYEVAIKEAVKVTFPATKHVGCWFHFSQAIGRKARNIGIRIGENNEWKAARQLMATALVPPTMAQEAVDTIAFNADSENSRKLIDYFRKQWLQRVTTESFSVYKQTIRTNNAQEALNRSLNRTIKPRGNPWDFWTGLQLISTKEINYFKNLSRGREPTRSNKLKWLLQDHNIKVAQQKLEKGEMTLNNFLSCMSYRIGNSGGNVAEDEEAVEEEVVIGPLENLAEPPQNAATAVQGQQEEEDAEPEVPDDDGFYERQVDESLAGYRSRPTKFNPSTPFQMCSAAFCRQQLEELTADMEEAEGVSPVEKLECCLCTVYEATRMSSPCGHVLGCANCVKKFLETKIYLQMTRGDGSIGTYMEYPLPARCPICQCLIGKVHKLFTT